MRCVYLVFIALCMATVLEAKQKLEVFTLENRDAESLVEVIASTIGPEGRVTADTRTNSLIVSYPEEMQESLTAVIAQLDRQEPNIEVTITTFDVESAWFEHLGLTAGTGLSPSQYTTLLPLLIEDRRATLQGQQQIITRNNQPAQLFLGQKPKFQPEQHGPNRSTGLAVTPRLMGNGVIEVKLAQSSPALANGSPNGQARIFSTIAIADGGAQTFSFNQMESINQQAGITIFPLGFERKLDRSYQRLMMIHTRTTDYNPVSNE